MIVSHTIDVVSTNVNAMPKNDPMVSRERDRLNKWSFTSSRVKRVIVQSDDSTDADVVDVMVVEIFSIPSPDSVRLAKVDDVVALVLVQICTRIIPIW